MTQDGGESAPRLPLTGVRVLDASTVLAGPTIAQMLGDFGADVIKVEHPKGDSLRAFGYDKDGVSLYWKLVNRNKRCITLNFSTSEGQELIKKLVAGADVLIENFRPGTMERWGLGYDRLSAINPRLVMVRVTGFGQTGPLAEQPGFGTIAEAMSGFAHINGDADGPPTLPPVGLGDTIAAHYGTYATLCALYERDAQQSQRGQVVDLSIYEPMFAACGYQATLFDQVGKIQRRMGNKSAANAPRGVYQTRDGRWVALSAATASVTRRVLLLTGGPQVADDPRFQTGSGRRQHSDELDRIVGAWIAARSLDEVLAAFAEVQAAAGPVLDIEQIMEHPHFQARQDIICVADGELGTVRMQNVFPFLSRTPGVVRHAGMPMAAPTAPSCKRARGACQAPPRCLPRPHPHPPPGGRVSQCSARPGRRR